MEIGSNPSSVPRYGPPSQNLGPPPSPLGEGGVFYSLGVFARERLGSMARWVRGHVITSARSLSILEKEVHSFGQEQSSAIPRAAESLKVETLWFRPAPGDNRTGIPFCLWPRLPL
jgi:hypothetical protein